MSRLLKVFLLVALLSAFAAPAWCQTAVPPPVLQEVALPTPVPPGVAPAWAPVPTAPKIFYAPNIPGDLFLLHKKYYYYSGGFWYRSKHLRGPYRPVQKLPKALYRVDRRFFKTPPPW